jgi:hypothetical protein
MLGIYCEKNTKMLNWYAYPPAHFRQVRLVSRASIRRTNTAVSLARGSAYRWCFSDLTAIDLPAGVRIADLAPMAPAPW